MRRFRLALGLLLIALSTIGVIGAFHELILWEVGERRYQEQSPLHRPIEFGGRRIDVADDQPTDASQGETPFEGTIQIVIDGEGAGLPSRALVRRGRRDLGRYHLWVDAWLFTDKRTGTASLWLARRLQSDAGLRPRFEVTTVSQDGAIRRSELSEWELARDYPTFRSTQFLRGGAVGPFPLSPLALAMLPLLWLIYPLGTFTAGGLLVRSSASRRSHPRPN